MDDRLEFGFEEGEDSETSMWKSWFGGFAEPSDYANAQMPSINLPAIIISSVFAVPYLAFLVILPGVREKRLITLAVFTDVALVGAILAVSLHLPGWTGGSARIVAQFRSHVSERMRALVGVHVGLTNINITLSFEEMIETDQLGSRIDMTRLYYNENFDISGVSSMAEELRSAYQRGLPYPILSILEYFSLNQDAFDWGRHYRTAGHYTWAGISFALACWTFSVVCLLFIPHQFGIAMLVTGLSALISCLLYLIMSPCRLQIGFVGTQGKRILIEMSFQWAFYCVFAAGLLAVFVGLCLLVLQHCRIYTLSTFLDARLDEFVCPTKRSQSDLLFGNDLQDHNLQVKRRKNLVTPDSMTSEEKLSSSTLQSRTSYLSSSRSRSSLESVHGDLRIHRSLSDLTIFKDDITPAPLKDSSEFILSIERF